MEPLQAPAAGRPSRPRIVAIGASVLVVIALVVTGVLVLGRSTSTGPTGSAPGSSLTGTRWTLVALTADGREILLGPEPQCVLAFDSSTQISLDDGLNAMGGQYQLTATGFSTRTMASTAVGYDGSDPNRVATIAAMDAIAFRENVDVNEVQARRRDDRLVISVGTYRLTFIRAGDAPTPGPVQSTSGAPTEAGRSGPPEAGDASSSAGFSGSASPGQ
jgi:hypothetical protein